MLPGEHHSLRRRENDCRAAGLLHSCRLVFIRGWVFLSENLGPMLGDVLQFALKGIVFPPETFHVLRCQFKQTGMRTIAIFLNRTLRKPIPIILVLASAAAVAPSARSAETQAVVAGNTAFAIDLYGRLRSAPGNLFFSPYSISTC